MKKKEFRKFLEILLLKALSDGNFKEDISVDELGRTFIFILRIWF